MPSKLFVPLEAPGCAACTGIHYQLAYPSRNRFGTPGCLDRDRRTPVLYLVPIELELFDKRRGLQLRLARVDGFDVVREQHDKIGGRHAPSGETQYPPRHRKAIAARGHEHIGEVAFPDY